MQALSLLYTSKSLSLLIIIFINNNKNKSQKMTNYTDPHPPTSYHFMMCQNAKRTKSRYGRSIILILALALIGAYAYQRSPELFETIWVASLVGQTFGDTAIFALISSFISFSLATLVIGRSIFGHWGKTLIGSTCYFLVIWFALTWLF
jgi:hypothetical protein